MIKNGPWKIKSSQEKYKNPWLKVREDKVIGRDGKDGVFGIVEMLEGVYILPIDQHGYVYLIEQFRYTIGRKSIEVAGGSLDSNEKPYDTAKRELKEETGITAKKWINLGKIYPMTTSVKTITTIYLARELRFNAPNPDNNEKFKLIKVKINNAVKMVMENKINHCPSCFAILKASMYLGEN